MYQADGSGGISNMENAGSKKQKKITKIVLFISAFNSVISKPRK